MSGKRERKREGMSRWCWEGGRGLSTSRSAGDQAAFRVMAKLILGSVTRPENCLQVVDNFHGRHKCEDEEEQDSSLTYKNFFSLKEFL